MKERPILFKPEMVRAIIEGRKTQTRRVVKDQERQDPGGIYECKPGDLLRCPYGEVGDRLWVRETWQYYDWSEDGEPFIRYAADNQSILHWPPEDWAERVEDIWESLSRTENYSIDSRARDRKWRPSLLMPRWACRLVLDVTDIRVERLNEITEEDAKAEGCRPVGLITGKECILEPSKGSYLLHFKDLWHSIHQKDGKDWVKNPFVWVIHFHVVGG